MDLDSWKPTDIARRLATTVACLIGVTAFLALWLGFPMHFLLGLLGGGVIGFISFLLVRPLIQAFYR